MVNLFPATTDKIPRSGNGSAGSRDAFRPGQTSPYRVELTRHKARTDQGS